jgi:trehalose 6-phosphate phosphatase
MSRVPPVDLDGVALLLDVDGTLLDFAPTPREVFVPPTLREALRSLLERTEGALALVSGRPIEELDLLFAPLQLPAAGGHGAEIRVSPLGHISRAGAAPLGTEVKRRLATIAAIAPGIILEDKAFSLAIHYRLAPEQEETVRDAVLAICEDIGSAVEVLPGKYVLEVKSGGFDKGTAVRQLMAHPPFRSRRPVFLGDDTTDEAAIGVMPEFDGVGVSVGRMMAGAQACFDTPQDVRTWLQELARPAKVTAE